MIGVNVVRDCWKKTDNNVVFLTRIIQMAQNIPTSSDCVFVLSCVTLHNCSQSSYYRNDITRTL